MLTLLPFPNLYPIISYQILDGIMRRVSKPATPKGQEPSASNGNMNDTENGNLDSRESILNVEPIEAAANY